MPTEPQNVDMEEIKDAAENMTLSDDGVFKVTLGPATTTAVVTAEHVKLFQPAPRMNSGLAVKHNTLFLYGGMFEDGSKQITFSDMYSIDLKKMDEWKTIITDDTSTQEWLESSSSEDEQESESESDVSGSDSQMEVN